MLGNIESEVANIHGTVNGEIRARSVIMSSTARVTGDVIHEELTIDAGAYIEGQMMRRDAEQSRLNLVVGDNVYVASRHARNISASTLPPDSTATTVLSAQSSLFPRMAASATAPPGSTTSLR